MVMKLTVARKSGWDKLKNNLLKAEKLAAAVGIPATTSAQRNTKTHKAGDVNNAELLYVFSKGSPMRGQPARPVLEPSIQADGNRQPIAREIAGSAAAVLRGEKDTAVDSMQRAALAGQNAAREWFTDPRNNWAPNTQGTIKAKGSDRPGIDTGVMRGAIQGIVLEDK